jgi:uncharacterized membrane protein HdeD (DUF308 family)
VLRNLRSLIARHLPWWLVFLLGAACVVLGAVLTARPFESLAVLAALVAAALIVAGVSELASAEASPRPGLERVVGIVWMVAGIVAAAWPGISIGALGIAVGAALIAGGVVKVVAARTVAGDERFLIGLGGVTSIVVGVVALVWPGLTVLVLAVVFGVGTVLFGFGQIAMAGRPPTESSTNRPGATARRRRSAAPSSSRTARSPEQSGR